MLILQALVQTVVGPSLHGVHVVQVVWSGVVVNSAVGVGVIVVSNVLEGNSSVETVAESFTNV